MRLVVSSVFLSTSPTASSKSCLDPEFLKAIPIMKTRSGMQVCVRAWVMWVHIFKAKRVHGFLFCVCYAHVLSIIVALCVVGVQLCTCMWILHMCHVHMGVAMDVNMCAWEQRLCDKCETV